MTTEGNLNISRRFFTEFLGKGNLKVGDEVLDENGRAITGLKPDGAIAGREEYKQIFAEFFDAFPPVAPLEIEDFFAAQDRVVSLPVEPTSVLEWIDRQNLS